MNNLRGKINSPCNIQVRLSEIGPPGRDGLSAYEIWLSLGNEGSEEEFLASLKGEPGDGEIIDDYNDLRNLPSIEGVILQDNKDFSDFGWKSITKEEIGKLL